MTINLTYFINYYLISILTTTSATLYLISCLNKSLLLLLLFKLSVLGFGISYKRTTVIFGDQDCFKETWQRNLRTWRHRHLWLNDGRLARTIRNVLSCSKYNGCETKESSLTLRCWPCS